MSALGCPTMMQRQYISPPCLFQNPSIYDLLVCEMTARALFLIIVSLNLLPPSRGLAPIAPTTLDMSSGNYLFSTMIRVEEPASLAVAAIICHIVVVLVSSVTNKLLVYMILFEFLLAFGTSMLLFASLLFAGVRWTGPVVRHG